MAKLPAELGKNEIYRVCGTLSFGTTADLPDLTEIIGQDRAVSSVEFGMGIDSEGYNIFAVGPLGTGKTTTVYEFLKRAAASLPAPDDWIYVYNFAKPSSPNAIRMPGGKAQAFRKDMEKLVEDLQAAITQAFEGEEYEKQKRDNRAAGRRATGSQAERLEREGRGTGLRDSADARGTGHCTQDSRRRDHVPRGLRGAAARGAEADRRGPRGAQRRVADAHAPRPSGRARRPRRIARARPEGHRLRGAAFGGRDLRALVSPV